MRRTISYTEVILQPSRIWDFRDRNAFTLYDRKTCILIKIHETKKNNNQIRFKLGSKYKYALQ